MTPASTYPLLLYFLHILYILCFPSFARLDFCDGFAATLANGGIARILSHVRGIIPAALALLAVGALHGPLEARHGFGTKLSGSRVDEIHLRDDEKGGQHRQIVLELGLELKVGVEKNFRLKPRIDQFFFVTRGF